MLKFHDISRAGTVIIFLWKIKLLWIGSNFTCMFLMMIPICSASFMKFDEIWKKCWNFMIFQRAGTVGIFLWNKSTSLNRLKFNMHVSDDDSNKFCKFVESWWTLKKMLKFHDISRAGTVSIFLWNKSTSLNGLIVHRHVSNDDSNMFCKFDEIWWTVKKCWNFMIFLGRALSAFFYEISQPLWMGSYFTCMFLMKIQINSASFMKFGDFWKNVEI